MPYHALLKVLEYRVWARAYPYASGKNLTVLGFCMLCLCLMVFYILLIFLSSLIPERISDSYEYSSTITPFTFFQLHFGRGYLSKKNCSLFKEMINVGILAIMAA